MAGERVREQYNTLLACCTVEGNSIYFLSQTKRKNRRSIWALSLSQNSGLDPASTG